jgi:hypothetical protein
MAPRQIVECLMTGLTQLATTPRDRFLEEAQKELIAFERREKEFRKMLRRERAEQLRLPPRQNRPRQIFLKHIG